MTKLRSGPYLADEIGDLPGRPDHRPNAIWSNQTTQYAEYWKYYEGLVLEEDVESASSEDGKPPKKYPLKINLSKLAVQKHSFALLGEYGDEVVNFHALPKEKDDPTAKEIDEFLNAVWKQNNASSILPEQARIAHVCGGCVFKFAFDPTKPNKVRIEVILPDYFFPVWDSTDYHNLLEVEIAYLISTREAILKYKFEPNSETGDEVLYKEHWTSEKYEVTIGGQPIIAPNGLPYSGPNLYIDPSTGRGILPFEYFPIDRTGAFYGTSIIKQIMGLQDEYNARTADVGDAINEGVHPYRFGRNLPKSIKDIKLSRGAIKNLGMNAPNQAPPEIDYVQHPGLPKGTIEFLEVVQSDIRSVSHTPPVAYGIDEGSQRSALTLAFRMWPLTSFTRDTRGLWSAGFGSSNRKIMIIGKAKGASVKESWLSYDLTSKWAPIIPRDREQLVNENILLAQAKLRAPETAIRSLGDIDDIDAEIERIKEWLDYLASVEAKQKAKAPQDLIEPIANVMVE